MKKLFAATLLATTLASVSFASAMTAAPVAPAGNDVIHVAQGCGPGFHRGPYGRCIANRAVVRPYGAGYHRPAVRKCRYWGPGRRVCRTWW